MHLLLDDGSEISITLDDWLLDAWQLQCGRSSSTGEMDRLRDRLAMCIAPALAECLDSDLKPPTEAQVRYAMAIARALGIALPSEALRYRGGMTNFIDRFVDSFRQKRGR